MAEPIIMPRQGLSVESCILTEWKKDVGDQISKGDIVFTFETDKSTFEQEAEEEGVLLEKFFEAGDEVEVLANVGVIGEEGEDIEEFRPGGKEGGEAPETEETSAEEKKEVEDLKEPVMRIDEEESEESGETQVPAEDEVFISPRARRKAEKLNVDFKLAKPSGPEGRIIERDIESLAETGPVFTSSAWQMYQQLDREVNPAEVSGTGPGGKITTSDLEAHISGTQKETVQREVKIGEIPEKIKYEEKELSNIRKNIAGTMKQSLQSSAQLTLDSSFDATSILNYRQQIKDKSEELGLNNITLNAIILYAVSRTLENFPKLNAHLQEDTLKEFTNVHLGMAVDTDRGLMAATIFQANLKSLNQLAREAKDIAGKCQEGTINPDYLEGASFTVTNLGTLGIESFTPIINPPQTGILGINTIEYKTKKVEDGFEQYPAMGLSLTFDHRALDGAPAARFLRQLTTNLENFALLLAK